MPKTPEAISQWMSNISKQRKTKKGGRKIENDTPEKRKNRERVRKYRAKRGNKMKRFYKTSKEAHKRRDELNVKGQYGYKVFKLKGQYFVGTDSDWLLAVS